MYKPYTLEEKINIYNYILKIMIRSLETKNYVGFCTTMFKAQAYLSSMDSFNIERRPFNLNEKGNFEFEELLKFKPEVLVNAKGNIHEMEFFNAFWFALSEEGTQQRIAIVNQILKELNGS
jgi:hypothetical protein